MGRIIVTGATGFIGRYVVQHFLKLGYEVIGLGRRDCDNKNKDKNFVYKNIDLRSLSKIKSLFEEYDNIIGVVHLAAEISNENMLNLIETNCLGTYYLAWQAKEHYLFFFINISSIPIIGTPIKIPVDEEHLVNPLTLYHATKYMSEKIVEQVCANEMQFLNLRISSPIGLFMRENNFLSIILSRCVNNETVEVYGNGSRVQNYIDVRDISKSIECGIVSKVSGMFLIAGKRSISNLNLALLCKKITNSNSDIIVGECEDLEEKNCWEICIDKAKNELGFVPNYDIENTLEWILRYDE